MTKIKNPVRGGEAMTATRLTTNIVGVEWRAIQAMESELWDAGYADAGYGDDGQGVRYDLNGYVNHVTGGAFDDADVVDSEFHGEDLLLTIAYGGPKCCACREWIEGEVSTTDQSPGTTWHRECLMESRYGAEEYTMEVGE